MRVYLAGDAYLRQVLESLSPEELAKTYLLRTFASNEPWMIPYYSRVKDVILDSGAFTYMNGKDGRSVDWNRYIEDYAKYIKCTGVKHFIELDIDVVVGYEKVKVLRKRLEELTGKQPIPVWHISRGKQDFIETCQNYDYVALGGFVIREWKRKDYDKIPWFIQTAHQNGAKIHGLGFTCQGNLARLGFDSVDSSSWTIGNRFGAVYSFQGTKLVNYSKPAGSAIADHLKLAKHNFREWNKYAQWAEAYL